jgi:hypothetical protein
MRMLQVRPTAQEQDTCFSTGVNPPKGKTRPLRSTGRRPTSGPGISNPFCPRRGHCLSLAVQKGWLSLSCRECSLKNTRTVNETDVDGCMLLIASIFAPGLRTQVCRGRAR